MRVARWRDHGSGSARRPGPSQGASMDSASIVGLSGVVRRCFAGSRSRQSKISQALQFISQKRFCSNCAEHCVTNLRLASQGPSYRWRDGPLSCGHLPLGLRWPSNRKQIANSESHDLDSPWTALEIALSARGRSSETDC